MPNRRVHLLTLPIFCYYRNFKKDFQETITYLIAANNVLTVAFFYNHPPQAHMVTVLKMVILIDHQLQKVPCSPQLLILNRHM